MTYTGDVTKGGPAAVRTLDRLTISKVSVGPMDNNAYLLRSGDEQILIDAANDADTLIALIGSSGLSAVVTTHRHGDHWQALEDVVEATGARSLAHADDAVEIPVVTDTLTEGDTVKVGDCTLEVIHLVGHTPGSIALLYRDPAGAGHLWTGDSLFPGGHGKTIRPEDHISLMDDLEAKVFGAFGDDTVVHPGHGDDTILGAERPAIPAWRSRGW
jgi:glyoxylase-like metal-dependent hydrolase (beta-lactamase superfamily II)